MWHSGDLISVEELCAGPVSCGADSDSRWVHSSGHDGRVGGREVTKEYRFWQKCSLNCHSMGLPVNTKNWYKKGTDLWAEFGK
jgi:hypothetical protein